MIERTFPNFSNEKRSVPLYIATALGAATTALRQRIASVLALVRRIWSLRGLPLMPIRQPDSGQIEMAQRRTLSHPFASIQADPEMQSFTFTCQCHNPPAKWLAHRLIRS
ncbi:MAG: hypothetical protein HY019_16950 [Aquabacterium sp.]|nr:hypothetical protein [Aquabacterium sp.]MBI3383692.1 hypothetical protein [Aquabacterium sp.]